MGHIGPDSRVAGPNLILFKGSMMNDGKIGLRDVQAVYSGPEGQLWELVMGQQIHIGGLRSSMELAEKAGIAPGISGIDLCCCTGAGMRFLVRFRNVSHMQGVDATDTVVQVGRRRCEEEGIADQIKFTLADACQTGLPSEIADFVWGEDAWCYVADKKGLIAEAARLVKPGGVIAFTDWVDGRTAFTDGEAERFRTFMKFPNTLSLDGYAQLLADNGCEILTAEDTGQFPRHVDLYLDMLNLQLTYDALRIIGFDSGLMESMATEMNFLRELAHAGKIVQGRVVARKKTIGTSTMGSCCGGASTGDGPFAWFGQMIDHCVAYASAAKASGRPVVGTLCEYTPRELIMAAGGVPVCLCGGSAKTIPAAEQHLPANLCPLIKSTYGYHLLRTNPFLEMADLVVGETTCDGKKKMYELMAESRPMYVLELPHKSGDPDALEYWVREAAPIPGVLIRALFHGRLRRKTPRSDRTAESRMPLAAGSCRTDEVRPAATHGSASARLQE